MKELIESKINSPELLLTSEEAFTLAKELEANLKKGHIPQGTQEQIKKLIAGLGDKRGLLRRTFSESLGLIGKKALPDLYKALIHSSNVTVRRAAAKTLRLVGDSDALPYLLEALSTDQDPVVQGSSAGAMAIFGDKGVQYLLKVLKNPQSNSTQCGLARWGMAFIGAKGIRSLKIAAKSDHPLVRASAIAALGEPIQSLNDNEAKEILKASLNDPSNEVQIEAIRLIGLFQDERSSAKLLIPKLNSECPEIRKQASLSLMNLKAVELSTYLIMRLKIEKAPEVANIIRLALKRLKP